MTSNDQVRGWEESDEGEDSAPGHVAERQQGARSSNSSSLSTVAEVELPVMRQNGGQGAVTLDVRVGERGEATGSGRSSPDGRKRMDQEQKRQLEIGSMATAEALKDLPDHPDDQRGKGGADAAHRDTIARLSQVQQSHLYKNQINALFVKSWLVQKRQYKTNLCIILFPLVLIILLYVFQIIINNIIASQYGGLFGALNPPLQPTYLIFHDPDIDGCTEYRPPTPRPDLGRMLFAPLTDDAQLRQNIGAFHPQYLQGDGLLGNVTARDNPVSPNLAGLLAFGYKRVFENGGAPPQTCFAHPYIANNVSFTPRTDRNDFLNFIFDNWKREPKLSAGYVFERVEMHSANNSVRYQVYSNQSLTIGRDIYLSMNLIANSLYRYFSSSFNDKETELSLAGIMDVPVEPFKASFDIISIAGPQMYLFILELLMPVIMSNVVLEKEAKLREVMRMMGLKTSIYWIMTYLFSYLIYLVSALFMIIMAVIFGFRYYTDNDFGLYFLLFLIWGHTMVALAFFFSVFFVKSRSATVVGYLWIFGVGILAITIPREWYELSSDQVSLFFLQVVPPFALYRGLLILSAGVSLGGPGYKFSDIKKDYMDMETVYGYLIVEWVILMLLFWYAENVFPSSIGVAKEPFFCLRRKFWCGERKEDSEQAELERQQSISKIALEKTKDMNPDIREQFDLAWSNSNAAIRILGLRKKYDEFVAVKDLSMVIFNGECFGFLGPNGAGKTTTINMLCGLTAPSEGTATLYGYDIRGETDLVHLIMGVCPQENVLWESLTAGEHLNFFGRMKGLTGKALEAAIVEGLTDVDLLAVRNKKSGEYSGGMKRRLCVANALVGSPRIILLDEPTTGLDPAARRQIWSVIKKHKAGSSVLLTTHSMQEAEYLCDRLSIFERGELRVVGSSASLKHRFEKGYKLTLTCLKQHEPQVRQFVTRLAPEHVVLASTGGTLNFEISKEQVRLSTIFEQVENNKAQLGITDWGVSNTTLEEVFVRITSGHYDSDVMKRKLSEEDVTREHKH